MQNGNRGGLRSFRCEVLSKSPDSLIQNQGEKRNINRLSIVAAAAPVTTRPRRTNANKTSYNDSKEKHDSSSSSSSETSSSIDSSEETSDNVIQDADGGQISSRQPNRKTKKKEATNPAILAAIQSLKVNEEDKPDLTENFSPLEMYSLAANYVFPKKTLKIEGTIKPYTSVLHFFDCDREFATRIDGQKFICKICKSELSSPLSDFSNLNKHLIRHEASNNWYEKMKAAKNKPKERKVLSNETYNLIKFFISSDTAIAQMNNPYLRACIHPNAQLFSPFTFRFKILPEVFNQMNEEITKKLKECSSVTLIPDGWTGTFEYLGLAAQLTNGAFEKEIIIIGMKVLTKGHAAEEVQEAIEKIVNRYTFDKSKVLGK